MPIGHPGMQHALDGCDPLLPIAFRTRPAELALATERHNALRLAVGTQIHRMPVSRIATAQHLLHHRVHSFVAWMVALERRPAVGEDLLEDVLMGLTGRRHAPQSSQLAQLCQTRSGPEKEIPMGSSYPEPCLYLQSAIWSGSSAITRRS